MKIEYDAKACEVIVRIACGEAEISAAPISESGKSRMIGSTKGFVPVEGLEDVKIGVNLIKMIPKSERVKK